MPPAPSVPPPQRRNPLPAPLTLAALGVVFGDIGTSPLYTLKTVLMLAGDRPAADVTLGVLSLILWTLIGIVTIKYVAFAMRIDNDGEGGILALMALLGVKRHHRPAIIAIGLFGAALVYGDGAITPAISVLSALEGLELAAPGIAPFIVPMAVFILAALFAMQPFGTARIGRIFGPLMALWFGVLAALGLWGISRHPAVLLAIDPRHALHFLLSGGAAGFLVLGGVFLCVTGAEALYADMGHFGTRPIRCAWFGLVFPSLMLNYAGQAALVLDGVSTDANIFYRLCPQPLLIPLIGLATVATVIASQSIITGAFSMGRQAISLGWLPRLRIVQTSSAGYGQIYIGTINWLLMLVTVILTIAFQHSANLAAAYGIAVSLTMLMTTILLFIAMREIWHWNLAASGILAAVLLLVDAAFVVANMAKFADGGYVPLLLGGGVYGLMFVWHSGSVETARRLHPTRMTVARFMTELHQTHVARVAGTAVFLTKQKFGAPPLMIWHVRHNRALHRYLLALTIEVQPIPRISPSSRLHIRMEAPDFWRVIASYGFMERPDIPELVRQAHAQGCHFRIDDVTYYLGNDSAIGRVGSPWPARLRRKLFAFMQRNGAQITDIYRLPPDRIVEISRKIAI